MSLLEELKTLGVNVEEGISRLNHNEALYVRMLSKLVGMVEKAPVEPDFDFQDYQDVIEKAHALKGATGNLSVTPLYEAYTKIVDLLRAGDPAQANEVLRGILPVQKEILDCIARASS